MNTEEIDLLKNGLNFSIPPKFIKKTDVFCQFDMIAKFLTKDIEENEVSTQLKSELTHLANCYIYKYTPSKSSLKKHKILQKLRSQKNIIITYPDKGNGLVILNRSAYMKSMMELISDKKKFIKLTNDTTIKQKQALQRTLRKLNKKNIFSETEYSDLYPKGSKIARLHGTQKFINLFHQVLFLLCDLLLLL